jgi:hypothetical protein
MNEFTWQGTIEFSGTAEEFNQLSEVLTRHQVAVMLPGMDKLRSTRGLGGAPSAINELLSEHFLDELVAGQPHLSIKFNRDIRGGIRTAHLHLAADVVLLDKERFKAYVGTLAAALAERRVDLGGDYIDIIGGMNPIASLPVPLP